MTPDLETGQLAPFIRHLDTAPDPVALYAACSQSGLASDTLLLETAETSNGRGGRSLIVASSALRMTCREGAVTVRALNGNGHEILRLLHDESDLAGEGELCFRFSPIRSGSEEVRLRSRSPIDVIRLLIKAVHLEQTERWTTPFLVGNFAYDFLGFYEPLPPSREDHLGWPDFELVLPDQLIWIDHERRRSTVVCFALGGDGAKRRSADAVAGVAKTSAIVLASPPRKCSNVDLTTARDEDATRTAGVTTDLSDDSYAEIVRQAKRHIESGDVFQVVPSRSFTMPCPDSLEAYRHLRELNPSPYMFYINTSSGVLFGASPEIALRVEGEPRRVHIRPIAGTRPRGRQADGHLDLDLDSRLEAELRLDEKETAEHMMLVDLARNDVARVSEAGTRSVDRLLTVERYSHVMHLVSHVSGQLRESLDALAAYVATMNMGTLTGAPKIRAAQLLREFEATRRGPYGGAVGYVTFDGRLDTGIVIRSAVVKDGRATVRAGAGVVHDSDPVAEAEETRRKAAAVLLAISRSAAAESAKVEARP